ncbi:MAG: Uma2 family endonuclease [Bryobacteraceae bacterium]
MATAPSYLTVDQFERLYGHKKPYYEYWYGEAIQKPRATLLHSYIQGLLFMFLKSFGWRVGTEVTLRISPVAHPIPDLAADPGHIEGPYPSKPVALCIEILSPQDDLRQVVRKAAHYLDWGIKQVWIIDPQDRRAFSMSLDSPAPVEIPSDGRLVAGPESEISISLSELFAEADKMLNRSV